jgi:hypothetical protein
MRLNDVIVEDEQADEGVLGGIVGAAKGLMKGAPVKGWQAGYARSQGVDQTKAQATALYKDFFNRVGQSGQKATGQALIDYLTKKQYPIRQAKAIIDAAPVPSRKIKPNPTVTPTPADIDADWNRLATGANEDIQNVDEARGYYDVELSASTAWKAILAATQENLKLKGSTASATTTSRSAGGNVGSYRGNVGTSAAVSLTPDMIVNWFASQPAETRNNLLIALNSKHEELNKQSALATPTAEGYSRFLARDL